MTQAGWAGALALQPLLEALKSEKTISRLSGSLGASALLRHSPRHTRQLHCESDSLRQVKESGALEKEKGRVFFVCLHSYIL